MYYNSFRTESRLRDQSVRQAGSSGERYGMTVTELNRLIAGAIRSEPRTRSVTVTAEVSSFKHHFASGHWYFSLKDEESAISCVMFRQNNLRSAGIRPNDGDKVTCTGYVEYYGRDGRIQLYVVSLQPAGIGGLYEQFEALKRKLQEEGLFDPGRKRTLPIFPKKVAVVTSESGAALHDILNVSAGRSLFIPIVLVPTAVQGDRAGDEIAEAVKKAGRIPGAEVIILARGGGSAEDLWCFNNEKAARAVASSPIPIVTGIGHEVDFTICDFTADVRASTPSNAAELVFPDRKELLGRTEMAREMLKRSMEASIQRKETAVRVLQQRLGRISPERKILQRLENVRKTREALRRNMERNLNDLELKVVLLRKDIRHGIHRRVEGAETALRHSRNELCSVSPFGVLERGYALVYSENNQLLKSAKAARHEPDLKLRFGDGWVRVSRKGEEDGKGYEQKL